MASEAAKKEAAAEAARALAEGRGGGGHHTTPEPFALTQPKMRLVPPPEEEINPFHAGEVPATTRRTCETPEADWATITFNEHGDIAVLQLWE